MPALGVAEMVFVFGEIDRVLIALASGVVDGVGFEAIRVACWRSLRVWPSPIGA